MSKMDLKFNPADNAAVLINVAIESVVPNPYRDMTMFPFQQSKIDSLVESIQKTGFWPSIMARPKGNMVAGEEVNQAELVALIESGYDFSNTEWEQSFAHHRKEACRVLGFDMVPIIPMVMSDEQMLLKMALENKDGFGGNVNSQCETVRQTKSHIERMIKDYDTYEDYLKDAGDTPFFETAKAFKNAQTQGVGFRQVRRFLGETWSDMDVRAPFAVIKAVDKEFFAQEDIVLVPNLGLLNELCSLAAVMYEGHTPKGETPSGEEGAVVEPVPAPNWPLYYKKKIIAEVIQRISADVPGGQVNTTVSDMAGARQALQKQEVNPASYLRTKKGKTPFNVVKALKDEFILEGEGATLDKNLAIIEGLSEIDGLGDWEGFNDAKESLIKIAEKLAKGEALPEGDEPVVDINTELPPTGTVSGIESGFDGVEDTNIIPIGQLTQMIAGDAELMSSRIESLLGRIDEFQTDEIYTMSMLNLLDRVARVTFATIGKEALVNTFNAVTK